MVAGIESFKISLVDFTNPYVMGNTDATGIAGLFYKNPVELYPNPVMEQLRIESPIANYRWIILDATGREVMMGNSDETSTLINTSEIPSGVYLIKLISSKSSVYSTGKFVKY
jgi:hypothetical protein